MGGTGSDYSTVVAFRNPRVQSVACPHIHVVAGITLINVVNVRLTLTQNTRNLSGFAVNDPNFERKFADNLVSEFTMTLIRTENKPVTVPPNVLF